VTLHDLERARNVNNRTYWTRGFQIGDEQCVVEVWLGPKAPAGDRSAVLAALQALKPLRS
jgi:hypothetical protein